MGVIRSMLVPMALGGLVLGGCSKESKTASAETQESAMESQTETPGAYALGLTMDRIDGSPEPLSDYEGRVVLIVNVASKCGLTPQYEGLEALYREKKDQGLVILGFPANNFMGQEPGTDQEISQFCTSKYDVTFPMFSKISVTGADQHELYKTLSTVGGEPSWNFTKYLVDRQGHVVERFDPRTTPSDPELRAAIDRLLGTG